ncbi:MAG: hypothetical protein U9R03_04520 [Candidatus Aerophobetes bacterium]|nr:hypothetical protein [Candidatus Aerophobetes bacterium]
MGRKIIQGPRTVFESKSLETFENLENTFNEDISDVEISLESFQAVANGEFERVQHLVDKEKYWDNINSSVRLYGGIIQDNGDGTARVGAGGGLYKIEAGSIEGVPAGECEPMGLNTAQGGRVFYHTWDAVLKVELENHAYNYIFIVWDHTIDNELAGGPGAVNMFGKRYGNTTIVASTNFYMQNWEEDTSYYNFRNDVKANPENYPEGLINDLPGRRSAMLHAHTVGRVYKMDNEIIIRVCGTNGWNFNKRIQLFGEEFFPVIRARGLDISTVQGKLQFNVTEGVMWAEMANRFTVREFNMENGDTFTSWYQHVAKKAIEDLSMTTGDLAEIQSAYPSGTDVEDSIYDVIYSETDKKYYRVDSVKDHVVNWSGTGVISTGVLTLNNNYKEYAIPTEDGVEYNLTTSIPSGALTFTIGNTSGGSDIINLVDETTAQSILFIGTGSDVYFRITNPEEVEKTIENISVTHSVYGQIRPLYNNMLLDSNVTWAEVLDYVSSKIYTESKQDLTYLETNYPIGYNNNVDGIDHILLQLQSTDEYYEFDGTRSEGDRWIISEKNPNDMIIVRFIGDIELMNTKYSTGYNEIINIIVPTDDGKYWEYSGVHNNEGWVQVHGYVERTGWLRFYNQSEVDPLRFNDISENTLKDIPAGEFGVAWIYMVHDNTCHVVYGQDTYSTKDFANQASLPSPLPGMLGAYSTLVGKMTFTQGGTAFESAESPFLEQFVSSAVSLHNDLGGLDGGSAQQNKYYHLDEIQYENINSLTGDTEERIETLESKTTTLEETIGISLINSVTEDLEIPDNRIVFGTNTEVESTLTIGNSSIFKIF